MSKTDSVTVPVIPSRATLPDGSPNPDYDVTLDPGHGLWQAEKYFGYQEKWRVYISGDRENPHISEVHSSINGYNQTWPVDSEQTIPRDFAEGLISRRVAWRVG
jgi:hypothetical protein